MSLYKKFSNRSITAFFPVLIVLFLFAPAAFAASVTLAWDKSDHNAVKGYKIYYGPLGTNYKKHPIKIINSAAQTQCEINGLEPGNTYLFAATSHDGNGRESAFSKEISYKVPLNESSNDSAGTSPNDNKNNDSNDNNEDKAASDNGDSKKSGTPPQTDPHKDIQRSTNDEKPIKSDTKPQTDPQKADQNPTNNENNSKGYTQPQADPHKSIQDKADGGAHNKPGLPPRKPVLRKPENKTELASGEQIRLVADTYSHPAGNVHYRSHWQIRRTDQKNALYEKMSETDLTSHNIENVFKNGLEYAWRVGFEDAYSGMIAWSEENVFIVGEYKIYKYPEIAPGSLQEDYEMVSFTQWQTDACAETVFAPLLETDYSHGDYRIAAYDPEMAGGGYREYEEVEVIPGKAYWVLARRGLDLSIKGVPVSTDEDIFVPLAYNPVNKNGWSMVAVPNDAAYYWGDVLIEVYDDEGKLLEGPRPIKQLAKDNPYIDTRIWRWKNQGAGGYEAIDSSTFKLEPHQGYWINARSSNVSLNFSYDMQVSASNPGVMLAGLWRTGLEWAESKLLPESAYADYNAPGFSNSPPMPMAGLDGDGDESTPTDIDGDGGASCFINTVAPKPRK